MPHTRILQLDYLERAVAPLSAYRDVLTLARRHTRGFVRNALLQSAEPHQRRYRLLLKAARMTETSLKSAIIELIGTTVDLPGLNLFQLAQVFDRLITEGGVQDFHRNRSLLCDMLRALGADTVLRSLLIPVIRYHVGHSFTGDWHGVPIETDRLCVLADALRTCAPDYSIADLVGLLGAPGSTYPEMDEALRLRYVNDTFTALRDRLHNDPRADVSGEADRYREAIQAAFFMKFDVSRGSEWNFISLHFARQGLEATADAFKAWVVTENAAADTNKFALFRRVMGNMSFVNADVVAEAFAETTLHRITVHQRPGTARQAIMTPNNVIHELGHSFDAFAGFGDKRVGSLQHAVEVTGMPLDRSAMGRGDGNLNGTANGQLYFEHARIQDEDNDGAVEFVADTSADAHTYSRDQYLLYDLFGTTSALWNRQEYSRYGARARIDTFVQNLASTSTETAADAFLNWVRSTFSSETGQVWRQFFTTYAGVFLRNATLYHAGMFSFYSARAVIPAQPVATGTLTSETYRVRLEPREENATVLDTAIDRLPSHIHIYGWLSTGILSDQSDRWLLVRDRHDWLVWIASRGLQLDEGHSLPDLPLNNAGELYPSRPYRSSTDLAIIIENT